MTLSQLSIWKPTIHSSKGVQICKVNGVKTKQCQHVFLHISIFHPLKHYLAPTNRLSTLMKPQILVVKPKPQITRVTETPYCSQTLNATRFDQYFSFGLNPTSNQPRKHILSLIYFLTPWYFHLTKKIASGLKTLSETLTIP